MGNVAFLCTQGQIVSGETETLRNAVQLQSEAQSLVSTVVLDLAEVRTVDAHGLGVMLELREQLQAKGIGFKLMNVSKLISRVLEISRLDTVFEVTSGVEFFPAVLRPQVLVSYEACLQRVTRSFPSPFGRGVRGEGLLRLRRTIIDFPSPFGRGLGERVLRVLRQYRGDISLRDWLNVCVS